VGDEDLKRSQRQRLRLSAGDEWPRPSCSWCAMLAMLALFSYCRPLVPPWYHERTAELSGRRIFLKQQCDRILGGAAARLAGRLSWRKVRAHPGRLRALSVSHGQSGLDGALCVSVTGA
jgi:hypothetical protein